MFEKYIFRKYSNSYLKLFLHDQRKIRKIFLGQENCRTVFSGRKRLRAILPNARIEHFGSTAVPGLGGKGIIDIIIAVPKKQILRTKKKLEKLYLFRPLASTKERLFFRTDYHGRQARKVHIHLTFVNSKSWRDAINVRDYLIAHPKEAKKYETVKNNAVKFAKGDGEAYRKYKDEFLKGLVKKAGIAKQNI